MKNKLQAITQNWHKRYSSQSKIKQPFIKLSNKRKKPTNQQINDNNPPTFLQNSKPQSNQQIKNEQLHKIIQKLSSFIRKMQETLKEILYQKDVKWYLQYANTSQTQIMDNVSNSLNKYKNLLYRLKQISTQQNYASSSIKTDQYRNSNNTMSSSLPSSKDTVITTYVFDDKKRDQKLGQTKNNQPDVNFDILEFLLQYFEEHMIPQTHWSLKKQKHAPKPRQKQKTDFFSKYFGKFKQFNCYLNNPDQSFQQSSQGKHSRQQKLLLQSQVSNICEEINKQQVQSQKKLLKFSFQRNSFYNHNQNTIQNSSTPYMKPLEQGSESMFSLTWSGQNFESQKQLNQIKLPLIKPVQQTLNAILKIQQLKPLVQMSSIEKIAYLFDLESKIFVSSQFIQSAAYFKDDITTLSKTKYQSVWKHIHQNQTGNQKNINQQYKMMKMLMVITNASVIRELETKSQQNSWFKKMIFGLSFPRYFFQFSRAKLQNQKFLRKPNVYTTKSIWNLPQNGYIKQLKKPFIFQSIKCNVQFYIPRITSTNLRHFKQRKYDQKLNIFLPNQNSIRIRLLNYKQLNFGQKKNQNVYQTVIIHYHGGGFIALSSCTSQSYTRKWANALKVPVFSVDYAKPPEFRFPYPVLDCLEAYKFITCQIYKFMNIKPKKVIVAGDSAGGNLACSVAGLTIKLDMKIPDGLLLVYPAVDTRTKFTPSRINSFNDIILYPTLLMLCMQQYLGQQGMQNQNNPLASPLLLTQDYVTDGSNNDSRWPLKWPRSIILVGKKDPLYDDSLRLCQRLSSSNIEFHCQVYKNFSHAFLSIDKMVPQCAITIKDSIKFFEKLISGEPIGKGKLL